MLGTRQLTVTIDFHIMFLLLWKSLPVLLETFFKISSFVFKRRKKLTQVVNKRRVSE